MHTILRDEAEVESLLPGNRSFSIGGLFDIFTSPEQESVNPQIGIHFLEAYRFALDEINKNKSILYGFELKENYLTTERWDLFIKKIIEDYFVLGEAPTAVGPYESSTAAELSIVTSGISFPLVSYAASFDEVDEAKASHFFRTVPTDSFRVIAAVELMKELGWNFVSIISSHAQSGDNMARDFSKKISKFEICHSTHRSLPNRAEQSEYQKAIKFAAADPRAKGLVLFTSLNDSIGLLTEIRALNLTNRFYIVSATGMTNYVEVTNGNEAILEGSVSLEYATTEMQKFRDHFLKLNPTSRKEDEFKLFWEQTFGCKMKSSGSKQDKRPNCTESEKLAPGKGYYPNTPIKSVIDSIYALALANKHVIERKCSKNGFCNWKPDESHYYIKELANFLRSNTFTDYTLNFTNPITQKDPYLVEYEVLNYVKSSSGFENRKIGKWSLRRSEDGKSGADYLSSNETGTLVFDASAVTWKKGKQNAVSSCRLPCPGGQIYRRNNGFRKKCCWKCIPCKDNQITDNNICKTCNGESKPDQDRKTCITIPRRQFKSHRTSNIAVRVYVTISAFGILATIFVTAVFIKNNNKRIVRASGRDLCYFILAGIVLAFVVPFTYYVEPSIYVCAIRSVLPGMAFCMCYSPLFLKTNRIYRIFRNAQTSVTQPPLVSPQSQLIILSGIICVQILLGVAWSLSSSNNITKTFIPASRDFIIWYCDDGMAPLLLNLLLSVVFMICCTWYAFKTRNFPKNYNESKYIGITMYITCICWAVFFAYLLHFKPTRELHPHAPNVHHFDIDRYLESDWPIRAKDETPIVPMPCKS